jgi:RNA polymerase sigma factor (sigma-70 family)
VFVDDSAPASRAPLRGEPFADVLAAARAGAGWAFERLYEELAPRVSGYLRLRGASDPESLTNEVFLGVFRGLAGFSGDEESFRSWVFTIAHHRVVDDRRRRAVRPETTELDSSEDDTPGGNTELEALGLLESEWVRDLLGEVTADQRDVLLLRVLGDMSVEETAAALGKRPGAVKQLQRRGLATLRKTLRERGVTP